MYTTRPFPLPFVQPMLAPLDVTEDAVMFDACVAGAEHAAAHVPE
jgi:hypothetical protein